MYVIMYPITCIYIVHILYVLMFALHVYFLSCVYLLLVSYAYDFASTCTLHAHTKCTYHEHITDLGVHGDPADLRGNTDSSQDNCSLSLLPSLPLPHPVTRVVAGIPRQEGDWRLSTWCWVFIHCRIHSESES